MATFQLTDGNPPSEYWIIDIPNYGRFVYYGSEADAKKLFKDKCAWEGTKGTIRRADPSNKQDVEEVKKEINAVREDRQAGIKLPFLPSKGWF